MATETWRENAKDKVVNYVLDIDGEIVIVENVPVRVNLDTGERYFAPDTVERLQQIAWKKENLSRIVETPVFSYSD